MKVGLTGGPELNLDTFMGPEENSRTNRWMEGWMDGTV